MLTKEKSLTSGYSKPEKKDQLFPEMNQPEKNMILKITESQLNYLFHGVVLHMW
jgi:hypothetical protein